MIQKNDVMLLHMHKNKWTELNWLTLRGSLFKQMKEERIFLEQYKWTYNFKNLLSYILIFFHSELIINTFIEYTNNKSLSSLENTFNWWVC